jgi:hypothetical protein
MELSDHVALCAPREATIRIRPDELVLSFSDQHGRPRLFTTAGPGARTPARLARALLLHLAATFPWREIPPPPHT